LIRVHDCVSQPTTLPSRRFLLSDGTTTGKLEVFTGGKQVLASGVHPCGGRYVWDRELRSVESDFPIVDEDTFNAVLDDIVARAEAEGIKLTATTTAAGARGSGATGEGVAMPLALDELREGLRLIPNRDVPRGENPTRADEWLDDYDNWTSTAYMALAACGNTAETRALWLGWANGRAQPDQSAESVYDSAALSTDRLRFDGRHLLQLVRSLTGDPFALAPKFPDLSETELAAATEADKQAAGSAGKASGGHPEAMWRKWRAALERLRAARVTPLFDERGWKADGGDGWPNFDADDVEPVSIRPDIDDRHARGEVSMLAAAPGTGKSSLFSNYAMAIAWERPDLIGQPSIDWCGDVVIVSNEESLGTIRRRLRALRRAYGLKAADQKHQIAAPLCGLTLGCADGADGVAPTAEGIAFVDDLAKRRAKADVALVCFDTLTSIFSGVNENNPNQMDKAAGMLADIAKAGFLAVDVAHHTSKALDGKETPNSFRGSSAIGAKVREHSVLVPAAEAEGAKFGWKPDETAQTIKLSGQKANDKPLAGVCWFRRERQSLVAVDPRAPVDNLEIVEVVALRALPTPTVQQISPAQALSALCQAQARGVRVRRGGTRGRKNDADAHSILEGEFGVSRNEAEAIVRDLIQNHGVTTKPSQVRGNATEFLVLPPPPP
jgi:hypothetical protein